jgi:hypothetical protein
MVGTINNFSQVGGFDLQQFQANINNFFPLLSTRPFMNYLCPKISCRYGKNLDVASKEDNTFNVVRVQWFLTTFKARVYDSLKFGVVSRENYI